MFKHGIFAATCDYLTSLGWVVSRGQTPSGVNGYTTTDGTRQVVISEALSPAQAAKTALHEAAHVLLHITGDQAADAAHYIAHRGLAETEAESVAYTVAGTVHVTDRWYAWFTATPARRALFGTVLAHERRFRVEGIGRASWRSESEANPAPSRSRDLKMASNSSRVSLPLPSRSPR